MRLLVSVAGADEVEAAVRGGADIIDVKNPAEGALGANFPRVIAEARNLAPAEIPVSATIGDMPNLPGTAALAALGAAFSGAQYVKVGLKGVRQRDEAAYLVREVRLAVERLKSPPRVIATAYADAEAFGALPPKELARTAHEAGAYGCLIDTMGKTSGGLLGLMGPDELEAFVSECRSLGLLSGLAGSLDFTTLPKACAAGPDLVGVRTAALDGDRVNGKVTVEKTARLKDLMEAAGSPK